MTTPSVLFIGKKGDACCEMAVELVSTVFPKHEILLGRRGQPLPENLLSWRGDYLFSYLSPWIIPESLLNAAAKGAINFHPGPPEYPGIGCTNFALYNGESHFGVTCHHMLAKVDSGDIIEVKRFPIYERDTVWTLTQRCYAFILSMFQEIVASIARGDALPASREKWMRKPYKRRELDELCRITLDMSAREVARRVRAVTFPNAPGAFIEVAGYKFVFEGTSSKGTDP